MKYHTVAFNNCSHSIQYNSSVFGLGTTNSSKTDRKQIYIAVYKVIFPRDFVYDGNHFISDFRRSSHLLETVLKQRLLHEIDENSTNWRQLAQINECLPELS